MRPQQLDAQERAAKLAAGKASFEAYKKDRNAYWIDLIGVVPSMPPSADVQAAIRQFKEKRAARQAAIMAGPADQLISSATTASIGNAMAPGNNSTPGQAPLAAAKPALIDQASATSDDYGALTAANSARIAHLREQLGKGKAMYTKTKETLRLLRDSKVASDKEFEMRIRDLEEQIKMSRAEATQAKDNAGLAKDQLAGMQSTVDLLSAQVAVEMRAKSDALQAAALTQAKLDEAEERVVQLHIQLAATQAQATASKLIELESQAQASHLKMLLAETEAKWKNVSAVLAKGKAAYKKLREGNQQLKDRLSATELARVTLDADLQASHEDVEQLRAEVQALKQANTGVEVRLMTLDTDLKFKNETLEHMRIQLTAAQEMIETERQRNAEELAGKDAALQEAKQQVQQQFGDLVASKQLVEDASAAAQAQLASMHAYEQQVQERVAELTEELQAAREMVKAMWTSKQQVEATRAVVESELAASRKEQAALQQQVASLMGQVQTYMQETMSLEDDLQLRTEAFEGLKVQTNHLYHKVSELESTQMRLAGNPIMAVWQSLRARPATTTSDSSGAVCLDVHIMKDQAAPVDKKNDGPIRADQQDAESGVLQGAPVTFQPLSGLIKGRGGGCGPAVTPILEGLDRLCLVGCRKPVLRLVMAVLVIMALVVVAAACLF